MFFGRKRPREGTAAAAAAAANPVDAVTAEIAALLSPLEGQEEAEFDAARIAALRVRFVRRRGVVVCVPRLLPVAGVVRALVWFYVPLCACVVCSRCDCVYVGAVWRRHGG
jgi:hypothetical protein